MHAYVDMKTRTYHRVDCLCVKHIQPRYFMEMRENIANYYKLGYKPCPVCAPLITQFKKEEKEIKLFCMEHSIKWKIVDESLLIDTYYSSWKIIFAIRTGGDLILYHENNQQYSRYNQVKGNIIKQYHIQDDVASVTIMGYLNYIVAHDKFRETKNTKYKHYNLHSRTNRFLYRRSKKKDRRRCVNRVYNILEEIEAEKMASNK